MYEIEHLPVGVPIKKGVVDRTALNDWWTERSIPASRSGIRDALETLNIANTKMLWICPQHADITWDKINFFNNAFSDDIGDVLFGTNKKNNAFDFSSPDKKIWELKTL